MRRPVRRAAATLSIFLLGAVAFGQTRDFTAVRVAPNELAWVAQPNGIFRADLAGSLTTPGFFVYRMRFPRGYRATPHSHPEDRLVTVISGTFYVGYTERFDETAVKRMPPGSTWTEPIGQLHYGWAKDGEVEIQVVGYRLPRSPRFPAER